MSFSKPHDAQILPAAEEELLLLLLMRPETAEELESMLAEADRREFNRADGSGHGGIMLVLQKLKNLKFVTDDAKPGIDADTDERPQKVWRLTERGRLLARQAASKLIEWDETFRIELLKLGVAPDAATGAVGAVSDSGENHGDAREAARRYIALHQGKGSTGPA